MEEFSHEWQFKISCVAVTFFSCAQPVVFFKYSLKKEMKKKLSIIGPGENDALQDGAFPSKCHTLQNIYNYNNAFRTS